MDATRLFVWLMSDPQADTGMQGVVDELASAHGGPPFEAHMTVFGGTFEAAEPLLECVTGLAAETAPLRLELTGVDVGDTFTKCLFARFAMDQGLEALTEAIRPLANPPAGYTLDPHVSLFYGDPEVARTLLEEAALEPGPVRFDRLTVIRSAGPTTRPEHVLAWEELLSAPLSG